MKSKVMKWIAYGFLVAVATGCGKISSKPTDGDWKLKEKTCDGVSILRSNQQGSVLMINDKLASFVVSNGASIKTSTLLVTYPAQDQMKFQLGAHASNSDLDEQLVEGTINYSISDKTLKFDLGSSTCASTGEVGQVQMIFARK